MKMINSVATVLFLCTLAFTITACKNEPKVVSDVSATHTNDHTSTGKIKFSLKNDGRKWKIVSDDTQEQLKMTQYILENEEPENVTELLSVTEMSDINITPADYFSQFMTELQKRYHNAKVESKIINQKTNSLLGEWWIDGVSPDNTQHEWVRIIKKGNDIAVLRYSTMHTDQLERTRKIWEAILNDANFQ